VAANTARATDCNFTPHETDNNSHYLWNEAQNWNYRDDQHYGPFPGSGDTATDNGYGVIYVDSAITVYALELTPGTISGDQNASLTVTGTTTTTGYSAIEIRFYNLGSLDCQSHYLYLKGGGESYGDMQFDQGTGLHISNMAFSVAGNLKLLGATTIDYDGSASLTLSGTTTGSGGTNRIVIPIYNTGTLECQSGVLALDGGGFSSGTLGVVLASASSYSQFTAGSGVLTLGGTFRVSLLNEFSPQPANTFDVITSTNPLVGQFDFVTFDSSDGSAPLKATYIPATNPTKVRLVYVPRTTVAVSSSPNPSTYGQPVTFTATVSKRAGDAGSATPSGTVQLKVDGFNLDSLVTLVGQADRSAIATWQLTSLLSAGSHTVTAVYSGDANFLGSTGTLTGGQTVNQAALTVTGITANDKQYDGGTVATLSVDAAALEGVIGDDDVSLAGTAVGTFADKDVGTGKTVTVSGQSLVGDDAGNYSLSEPAPAANIAARELTVSATAESKFYDCTTIATVTLSDDRVADDDQLTITYTSANFADKYHGTDKIVTVTGINVTGPDAGNYTFNTTTTTQADINSIGLPEAPVILLPPPGPSYIQTTTTFDLAWGPVAGADSYNVPVGDYYTNPASTAFSAYHIAGPSVTVTLTDNHGYIAYVQAVSDDAGTGPWSWIEIDVCTYGHAPSEPPAFMTPSAIYTDAGHVVSFTWTRVANAARYWIAVNDWSEGWATVWSEIVLDPGDEDPTTEISSDPVTLLEGHHYCVYVVASNPAGNGPFSEPFYSGVSTAGGPPTAPEFTAPVQDQSYMPRVPVTRTPFEWKSTPKTLGYTFSLLDMDSGIWLGQWWVGDQNLAVEDPGLDPRVQFILPDGITLLDGHLYCAYCAGFNPYGFGDYALSGSFKRDTTDSDLTPASPDDTLIICEAADNTAVLDIYCEFTGYDPTSVYWKVTTIDSSSADPDSSGAWSLAYGTMADLPGGLTWTDPGGGANRQFYVFAWPDDPCADHHRRLQVNLIKFEIEGGYFVGSLHKVTTTKYAPGKYLGIASVDALHPANLIIVLDEGVAPKVKAHQAGYTLKDGNADCDDLETGIKADAEFQQILAFLQLEYGLLSPYYPPSQFPYGRPTTDILYQMILDILGITPAEANVRFQTSELTAPGTRHIVLTTPEKTFENDATLADLKFIRQNNAEFPLTEGNDNDNACHMVSKFVTSANLQGAATFDGPPGNPPDPDTFRVQIARVPKTLNPKVRLQVYRQGNMITDTNVPHTYDLVRKDDADITDSRTDRHVRLVSNGRPPGFSDPADSWDDEWRGFQTVLVSLDDIVSATVVLNGSDIAFLALPVGRPYFEDGRNAVRTVDINFITLAGANSSPAEVVDY